MGNTRDHTGPIDVAEAVGGVARPSMGDDEGRGAVHCGVGPIAYSNGSPLLDGSGHGFTSIVTCQPGDCPALGGWELGPGRVQSGGGGEVDPVEEQLG